MPSPIKASLLCLSALSAVASCTVIANLRSSSGPATPAPTVARHPIPYPVWDSPGFARAVANGTRTRTGAPGPKYWQQSARYHIDAELVPATSQINGRETVRYVNNSPDTLRAVWVYLDQNLFAPSSPRTESVPVTGGTEVLRVSAWSTTLAKRDTGAGYAIDGTRMQIRLPRALTPHDSLDLDIAWDFQVPPDGAPREGSTGDTFMIAYWYPQLAVYDDVDGWHTDPYLGTGEFYMDYADYDVSITLPQGWLVGSTGELTNADQVLSPQTRARIAQARRTATTMHVVTERDRGAGPTKATNTGFDGAVTWRFRARNVRDFDWGASRTWLWDATRAVVGDRMNRGRPDTTAINTFYRPEARRWAWDRSAEYEKSSVEFLSKYLWPYPWPQMTAVEGPWSCSGMEYPMLTCVGGPRDTVGLYSVLVHETGHMWFPMQVGSDERRYAWQDEGLTRFNQIQGMQAFLTGWQTTSPRAYIDFALSGNEVPLMRPADQFPTGTSAYAIASYEKMATNMISLRALLGDENFVNIYRTYGLRWLEKHPTPYDFFNTFSSLSGKDLSWFFRTWWYETWTLDQAIGSVTTNGNKLVVTIENRGLAPMPILLAVKRTSGATERYTVPVDVWLTGAPTYAFSLDDPSTVASIDIDPANAFPDVDRSNNHWARR
ncbi:MAG TPA: M1 family metallopeptidase [Gemmatimonadaceae bacterium]|nr:M1 family metallopeptidase [Gemmatimonadaceae bacterium]